MIILSNTLAQTLAPGQSLVFDNVILKTGCGAECHRRGTSNVNLVKSGVYDIAAKVNISPTEAGSAEVAVVASGGQLPETLMISTPTTPGNLNTVSCETGFRPCGPCGESITLQNVGTIPITVGANACLFVKRIA